MKYKFKAIFEKAPNAYGEIEAATKKDAEKILFGICGTWHDKDGKSFQADTPIDVEII